MDAITEDLLAGDLVPVLLGYCHETAEAARRIYKTHRVVSHVFCPPVPLPLRLSLCMKFHTVPHTAGEQLMLNALSDFADQLENADVILYLIPCTAAYANLTWLHKEQLERRFVLADKREMYRIWFGEDAPQIQEVKK